VNNLDKFSVLVNGLDHPEGVAWGPDGNLYAGGEAGQLYRIDLDAGTFSQVASTSGFLLGVALDGTGHAYACDMGRKEVVRIRLDDGTVETYSNGSSDIPARTPNWLVFDRKGELYFSDSGEWKEDDGLIYKVSSSGATAVWSKEPRRFTNGMALNPEETHLYVVESLLPGVSRVAINPDGSAGKREVVVELPGNVPDGVAFAEDGTLYIACYYPSRIYRVRPGSGDAELFAEDSEHVTLSSPCNLAFAGPNRDVLVASSLGRWHLASARLGVRGAALNYPTFNGQG
jgi:gluconolactonase